MLVHCLLRILQMKAYTLKHLELHNLFSFAWDFPGAQQASDDVFILSYQSIANLFCGEWAAHCQCELSSGLAASDTTVKQNDNRTIQKKDGNKSRMNPDLWTVQQLVWHVAHKTCHNVRQFLKILRHCCYLITISHSY